MSTYTIEITKVIVVEIEAETADEAMQEARDDQDGFDGAWERAESNVELLEVED